LGGFNSHLVDSKKLEVSTSTRSNNLDELLLPNLPRQIERTSVFNVTSIHAAPGLLRSDSNQSEEATQSKSLSNLEEDLDRIFKIRDDGATACRGPPIIDYDSKNEEYLLTTSSSQGGLEDGGTTTHQEAPVLDNHSQPDDYSESFLGNHSGLTIKAMPQGCFLY
jgi:hypothetical protein